VGVLIVEKCIGGGHCVRACKTENNVLDEPMSRTWVERYHINMSDPDHRIVDSPDGASTDSPRSADGDGDFFVPKMCNHYADSPCTQVCPVGATFITNDGVVLIDKDYCVGCRSASRRAHPGVATSIRTRRPPTNAHSAITA
jgi:Fe-S-cluster-containing dehydrogenase component